MKAEERAAQIWSVLALASRNRQELTYKIVGSLTGLPPYGLGRNLELIQSYCLIHQLPALTVLAVDESGIPGPGFTAAEDLPAERQRVFSYDWLAHGAPRPAEFAQATKQRPSNGDHRRA